VSGPRPSLRKTPVGQQFPGTRLTVLAYAGRRAGKALWACGCECGNVVIVRRDRLIKGRQVSCGCQRSDPEIRQRARAKVAPERRSEIASLGAKARRAAQARKWKRRLREVLAEQDRDGLRLRGIVPKAN
jgi:hypothetical protein